MDQDNLHMKFSALNIDFSGLGPNLLHSMRPMHAGVVIFALFACLA